MKMTILDKFSLIGKTCVITGGCGLMGLTHAYALLDAGAGVALLDINRDLLAVSQERLSGKYSEQRISAHFCDITSEDSIKAAKEAVLKAHKTLDVLINNAANNPKVEDGGANWSGLENFSLDTWNRDLSVGITGAFLCSKVFGAHMAENGGGVIINISSDLGVIAPDQRIYTDGPKPVTYSVIKHGIIGLTKYLATYWADKNVRVNSICPGGIYNGQPDDFVKRLTNLIPMGRMAELGEYGAAIIFLASGASSYMTGANLVIDGGRTCW